MTSSLRVALVSKEYSPFLGGGIGTYARWIVPALTNAGVDVHVITQAYDRIRPRVEVDGRVFVHRIPIGTGAGGWPNAAVRFSIQAARIIASLYRKDRIDLVEFAEYEAAGLATLLMNPDRPPTVVHLHTPSEQLFALRSYTTHVLDPINRAYFEMERMCMHLADEILAPSHFIADWATKHYRFAQTPTVIPYATGELSQPPPPADMSSSRNVFYAGRIEPRKGIESLILAFNIVARKNPLAVLRLAGGDTTGAPDGGSMRSYLQSLIHPEVCSRVVFLGRLDHKAMKTEYAKACICVIPSLWENFPNTCIESMANARAVLVSDQGGMSEMFSGHRAGEVFAAGDPDDLACAMDSMLSESAESLIERGRVARAQIEHKCDPQRIAQLRIEHALGVIQRDRRARCGTKIGTLSAWKGLEESLHARTSSFMHPSASDQVSCWVQRGEEAACNVS